MNTSTNKNIFQVDFNKKVLGWIKGYCFDDIISLLQRVNNVSPDSNDPAPSPYGELVIWYKDKNHTEEPEVFTVNIFNSTLERNTKIFLEDLFTTVCNKAYEEKGWNVVMAEMTFDMKFYFSYDGKEYNCNYDKEYSLKKDLDSFSKETNYVSLHQDSYLY